jgi:hypothetical protein
MDVKFGRGKKYAVPESSVGRRDRKKGLTQYATSH